MIDEHFGYSVTGTVANSDYYRDKRNGLMPLSYEEAARVKPGDELIAAISDSCMSIVHGRRYMVLSAIASIVERTVTFKITNENTKFANGKIIEVGRYFSYTLHHNLARAMKSLESSLPFQTHDVI